MIYKCVCPNCGFEFTLATNDTDDIEELTSCPCGSKTEVVVGNIHDSEMEV